VWACDVELRGLEMDAMMQFNFYDGRTDHALVGALPNDLIAAATVNFLSPSSQFDIVYFAHCLYAN
jgi:hypothetical protein